MWSYSERIGDGGIFNTNKKLRKEKIEFQRKKLRPLFRLKLFSENNRGKFIFGPGLSLIVRKYFKAFFQK
jgi:hypothetical protein